MMNEPLRLGAFAGLDPNWQKIISRKVAKAQRFGGLAYGQSSLSLLKLSVFAPWREKSL
jgi:hypothetical protein